jgi:hypothetical protein
LILYRGGPQSSSFLTRFFALLDISGSLFTGRGPLLQGNYWLDSEGSSMETADERTDSGSSNWPHYDNGGVMVTHFHKLMTYMAKLSILSSKALSCTTPDQKVMIQENATTIKDELLTWWNDCPPELRDQGTHWRKQSHELSVEQKLEAEAFSSTKACMYGCIVYLNHIVDPLGLEPPRADVIGAIESILDIARETPEGYGLEMGIFFSLFTAGAALFNDSEAEDLVRRKLGSDTDFSLYVCYPISDCTMI